MNNKIVFAVFITFVATLLVAVPITAVLAEKVGATPESGVTSRIKVLYDILVGEDKGADTAGDWGDWGSMWNRIYSATRYSEAEVDFSLQQYSARDDYAGEYNWGEPPEDYQGEEAEWTDYSVGADEVWKDERTGLYWSADRGTFTYNNFDMATCDFFTSEPRSSYDGSDLACGGTVEAPHAINYCATLDYGGRTDWYLPSQKELMQAYIDGMYNQAGDTLEEAAAFTWGTTGGDGGYEFWSSSEVSTNLTYAWAVGLGGGTAYDGLIKTDTYAVRCIAQD